MRFMVNKTLKNGYFNIVVLLTFLFGIFFWISDLIYTKVHYGLTYEEIYIYFFADFEFPDPISVISLLEDAHIYMFLYFMFNILFIPLFVRIFSSEKTAILYSTVIFVSSFLTVMSDFLIYYISPIFINLKIFLYIIYKISSLIALLTVGLLPFFKRTNIYVSAVNMMVVLFSLGSIFFLLLNIWMFVEKMGLSADSIFHYYNGNPAEFVKAKSIESLLSLFTAHVVAGAVFLFVLGHFFIFCNFKYKKQLFVVAALSMIFEFLGGILLKTEIIFFSYVKLVSFFIMEALLIFMSIYIIKEIIKGRLVWTYRKDLQEQS